MISFYGNVVVVELADVFNIGTISTVLLVIVGVDVTAFAAVVVGEMVTSIGVGVAGGGGVCTVGRGAGPPATLSLARRAGAEEAV